MRNKKRGGKVFVVVALVLLLAIVSCAAYAFREEIALIYYALTTPAEEVQSQKTQNDEKANKLLNDLLPTVTMRDLTEEERALLASGMLSEEEALALIRGETLVSVTTEEAVQTTAVPAVTESTPPAEVTVATAEVTVAPPVSEPTATTAATTVASEPPVTTTVTETAQTTKETEPPITTEAPDAAAVQKRQEEIIAEVYLLRAQYLNEIDAMISSMKKEFYKLPKEEWTLTKKMEIVEKTLPFGKKLEADCDRKMNRLLTELEGLLQSTGQDTKIVQEIRDAYAEQKRLKMTELYNQYAD